MHTFDNVTWILQCHQHISMKMLTLQLWYSYGISTATPFCYKMDKKQDTKQLKKNNLQNDFKKIITI